MSKNALDLTSLQATLIAGANTLKLALSAQQCQQLCQYIALLVKWNNVYNLTAVRRPNEMVSRHILDSLAVTALIQGKNVLDVGSGAGLPGIPLAIALPDYQFTLLDSLGKRTRFLSHVVTELALNNVEVVNQRVESYQASQRFDTITARAVATCEDIVNKTWPLCANSGQWLLLKGKMPGKASLILPENTTLVAITPLHVPGLDEVRHSVCIRKT